MSATMPQSDNGQKPPADAAKTAADGKVTPMMAQYLSIKEAHPDALLFYRMGDFYELFFDDAIAAAAALDITLTHRGKHLGQAVPMCGVPFHASESYLQRLIKAGFRVAICEQTETPEAAKKRGSKAVVRRDVVRLVTAGTLSEDGLLSAKENNFIAALACLGKGPQAEWGLAWADMSTGEFSATSCALSDMAAQLARLAPREILLPQAVEAAFHRPDTAGGAGDAGDMKSQSLPQKPWEMTASAMLTPVDNLVSAGLAEKLESRFAAAGRAALETAGRAVLVAAAHIVDYFDATQYGETVKLAAPKIESENGQMGLDAATRANLELTRTLAGQRQGSLLAVLDKTLTAAGGRVLAARLNAPLTDKAAIDARLQGVAQLLAAPDLRADMRDALRAAPDLVRALSRLSMQRGGPRDVQAISGALAAAKNLYALLLSAQLPDGELAAQVEILKAGHAPLGQLQTTLEAALDAQVPLLAREGGFVAAGYHSGLDAARQLRDESRRVIAALQARYVEETGIKALKIKHNGVLGFHIDVPAAHGDKLMNPPFAETFIHRQTLANAVRFSSRELNDLAAEISRAGEQALALELEIFAQLRDDILAHAPLLEAQAAALAVCDVAAALADMAAQNNWTRPELHDDMRFDITGGRHPVVEAALADGGPFIANSCRLDAAVENGPRMVLLTGPNMAGKSTFLRQNALLAILAQMGSFVPAEKADIGIVDRVFSRVGAADDLARGRSTFMVEMVETAMILAHAGPRALVILDEIGRGTATFDGLSIAWATVEYLHEDLGCRTLFATHYHELTALAERLDGLANASMKVREHGGRLVFLHEVESGAADRSYGIHVAELAGLPKTVTARARAVLARLEENNAADNGADLATLPLFEATQVAPPRQDALRAALAAIDPDRLTPREALDWLYRLQQIDGHDGHDGQDDNDS